MNALLLPIILHRAWLVANLVAHVEDAALAPSVMFSPGIADRGTWACSVTVHVRTAAGELAQRTVSGTLEACSEALGSMLDDMLGLGTWRQL